MSRDPECLPESGHVAAVVIGRPGVIAATDRLLAMEPLALRDDGEQGWERLAHDLAAAHRATVHDRFGWPSGGYLGRVAQHNPWTAGGHEFLARHRLLRFTASQSLLTGRKDGWLLTPDRG